MASYSYIGIDKSGKEKKGSLEGDTVEQITNAVKAMGLIPVEIKEQNILNKDIEISFFNKASARDMSIFCRQFVSMIRAGVTILDSMKMMTDATENKTLKNALKEVCVNIEKGETLSDSMRKHEVFSTMLVQMVEAGEASGSLDVSFERMAVQFEKDAKLKGLIKKAMIYPIVVCIVAVGVVILMLTTIVPSFMGIFADMDMEMPALTLAVVAASEFMQTYWYLVVAALFALSIGFAQFRKSAVGQGFFSLLGIKIKLFRNFTVKSASARFARTLSTLLAAGIPMVDALEITSKTMSNTLFRTAMMDAREEVLRGIPLSEPLLNGKLFPPMVCYMVKIGEETGDIEAMLDKLADYYDEEVEIATQSLLAAMEPVIIVVLALIVGVLIGAVMMPMLSMYEGLDNL